MFHPSSIGATASVIVVGEGRRAGHQIFCRHPPEPPTGTGGLRESDRPLTAQDLDGLAVSWRLFWAWRTGGSTRVSSERVKLATATSSRRRSFRPGPATMDGNSLPPSVPPQRPHPIQSPASSPPHPRPAPNRTDAVPDSVPPSTRLSSWARGGVLRRREPHGTTGLTT